MRSEPPASASPIVPTIRPRHAAATPLSGRRPARMATIERPRMVIISISGRPKARTIGRAMRMKNVRMHAPNSPPNSDEMNAAERARAASPFFAIGKPSRTVAWEAEEPGMPMSTEAKVSEVGITAIRPTMSARPLTGSIPKTKGRTRLRPAMPPRPGNTPTERPSKTPIIR